MEALLFSRLRVLGKSRNASELGKSAEQEAARFLKSKQHKLLAQNFHCRFGEIDLITKDRNDCIVFTEVRFRSQSDYAGALESITAQKQNRLRKSAQIYLAKNPKLQEFSCRFDVLAMQATRQQGSLDIEWLQNAFY